MRPDEAVRQRLFPDTEMARWMEANGFRDITMNEMPRPNPHTLILGAKP